MELNSNHFFLTSIQDIKELIAPLKKYFGITTFVYKKNFNDGAEIRLSNNAEYSYSFYKNKFHTESLFEAKPSLYTKARVLWDDVYSNTSRAAEHSRNHDVYHGITFVEPFVDGCEIFAFGVPVGRVDLMHRYLSHIDLLEKFILYFRESAQPLFRKAEKSKIQIPGKFEAAPSDLLSNENSFFDRSSFLREVCVHSYKIFSAREIQCAELLLQGFTARMISHQLNLSPRTIESYVQNIKQKTNSVSKPDLIRTLSSYFK